MVDWYNETVPIWLGMLIGAGVGYVIAIALVFGFVYWRSR